MIFVECLPTTGLTKTQARALDAINAAEAYAERTGQGDIALKVTTLADDNLPAAAAYTWAAYCQHNQLCLHCGGELVLETWGSLSFTDGEVWDNRHDELICRECGRASDWQPVEVGIADELPI